MAQIDLGKLKFNWRGDWISSSSYEIDDVVYYNGSAYVAVQNNTASNPASQHALGTAWDKMAEGINYAGDWTSGTTYFKGDLVRWNNASYLLVASSTSGLYTTTNPSAIPTVWKILVNAPSASVLNASGGMIFRDNDDTTNVQLPIGAVGSQLSVIEKPFEDIANEGNYEYSPVLVGGTRHVWLTGDERETYESVNYTVTVATGTNNANQFYLSGGSLSGTVERPAITIKVGSQYVFDVSDASNTGHVFAFKYRYGSTTQSYAFVNGSGYGESDFGIVRNGTAGSAGATGAKNTKIGKWSRNGQKPNKIGQKSRHRDRTVEENLSRGVPDPKKSLKNNDKSTPEPYQGN